MRFLLRRVAGSGVVLVVLSCVGFVLLTLAPGDYLSEMRVDPAISAATVRQLERQYGLDRPLFIQYGRWLQSVARGDFGYSFAYAMPVRRLLLPRARNTLVLTLVATAIAWALAVSIGVATAGEGRGILHRSVSLTTSGALALPEIVVATLLLALAVRTRMLPVGGMTSMNFDEQPLAAKIADLARHAVLPVTAMVIALLPMLVRHVRQSVGAVLDSTYITAGRARGVSPAAIRYRHALRAAANPLVALAGLSIGSLLSASLVIEVVMGWPGLGPLLVEAILARDVFVVIAAVLASTALLLLGNLLADFALYALDPRVRRS